jgi:hypothetical protein
MKRSTSATGRLSAISLLLLAVVAMCGCAELGLGPDGPNGSRSRDDRITKLEKDSAETQAQLKTLVEQQQHQLQELSQLSARITGIVERATAQLEASERSRAELNKQIDALSAQNRGIRSGFATPKSDAAAECRWLGRRILLVLLRDDLIATDGFMRLYATLGCPVDYIGPVFACVNPGAQTPPGQTLEAQIDYCWQEVRKRQ